MSRDLRTKSKNIYSFSIILCLSIGFYSISSADDLKNEKIKKKTVSEEQTGLAAVLKRTYGDTRTLSANFTQIQKNTVLGTQKESSGLIDINRPDKFRWETDSGQKSLSLADGKNVYHYTPPFRDGEKGQVIIRKAADTQSKTAVELLSGGADLRKTFRYKAIGFDKYELLPIKNAGDINKIELFLDKKTRLVYKLRLFHATGNETELVLKNVKLGVAIESTRFEFKIPPNTEVVK